MHLVSFFIFAFYFFITSLSLTAAPRRCFINTNDDQTTHIRPRGSIVVVLREGNAAF